MQPRTDLCVDYTNGEFTFLAFPFPQLHANMQFALVQLLFRGRDCREFMRISIADTMWRLCRRDSLQAHNSLCVDCTNGGFSILASPFPQLLANM